MPVIQREGVDEVLSVLADRTRREVLSTLRSERNSLALRELAAKLGEADEKRLETELRHTHLPKLAAVDLVVYDDETGLVEATDRIREVQPLLDAIRDVDRDRRPWMFGVAFEPTIRSQQAMAEYCMESWERRLESLEG